MPFNLREQEFIVNQTAIKRLICFETISSTNDWSKNYVRDKYLKNNGISLENELPLLVITDEQTAGRGRGNHRWFSPHGTLLISLVMTWSQLKLSRQESSVLSFRIASAVQKTIIRFLDNVNLSIRQNVRIKIPNDIYIEEKKIAGILIESPNEHIVVVGIGVNLNNHAKDAPVDLQKKITTLSDLLKNPVDFQSFLIELLNEIL